MREARRLTPRPRITELRDRAAFGALQEAWDALAQRTQEGPFHRHAFIRIWLDNFAPRTPARIFLGHDPAGHITAALPLVEERTTLLGVPVRQLSAAANAHSCRFDLLADDLVEAAAAMFDVLRSDPSWDVLRLTDVPEGGAGWTLLAAAEAAGFPVGTWESLRSPYIPLPSTVEALTARLHTKFRANLRRRNKKLEERGEVTFRCVDGGVELAAALEEGFALEQSGWKGARGTAISQDRATRGFYTELARAASYAGRLRLYFLCLEGRAVAFQFGLEHAGKYLLLKPGYDESLKDCSPGQLLMERVVADCIARGLTEFDFLGPDMVWKRDWTDRVRVHTWLYVFRDSAFGRALRTAKFEWAPRAKEALRRWSRSPVEP